MKLSLMAAVSENGVIGNGPEIPWQAKGEQLLFKAMTYNQWLLVGRKTFESMGILPYRKYAVVSRSGFEHDSEYVLTFPSIEAALEEMARYTRHLIVVGGGEIFQSTIALVDTIHLSTIRQKFAGDVEFPPIPREFKVVFEQEFASNINYTYQILQKVMSGLP